MAVGDDAASVGYPIVSGATTPASDIDTEINRSRDLIAQHVRDGGHSWGKISGKPAAFPTTWGMVSGLPATFPTTWGTVSGKPATFPPAPHSHVSTEITRPSGGTVESGINAAAAAASAATANANNRALLYGGSAEAVRYAQGPTGAAYAREAGAGRYAVWMDAGQEFGRAVSSRRYKDDVEDLDIDPAAALALRPVSFHYKHDPTGVRDVGLIAEEVAEVLPQIVTYFGEVDGVPRIDGIRYDLLALSLISTVQNLHTRLTRIEAALLDIPSDPEE